MAVASKKAPNIKLEAQIIQVKDQHLDPHRTPALVAPGTGLAIHRVIGNGNAWALTHVHSGFCLAVGVEGATLRFSFKQARAMLVNVASKANFDCDIVTMKQRYMSTKKKREAMQNLLLKAWSMSLAACDQNTPVMVRCEVCGVQFDPKITGYHEPEGYTYCAKCCKW